MNPATASCGSFKCFFGPSILVLGRNYGVQASSPVATSCPPTVLSYDFTLIPAPYFLTSSFYAFAVLVSSLLDIYRWPLASSSLHHWETFMTSVLTIRSAQRCVLGPEGRLSFLSMGSFDR